MDSKNPVFSNHVFGDELVVVPDDAISCNFIHCHFSDETIVSIHQGVGFITLDECYISQGCAIFCENTDTYLDMRHCKLPVSPFLQGQFKHVNVVRISARDYIESIPQCQSLVIYDSKDDDLLVEPLPLFRGAEKVKYCSLTDQTLRSLEMITMSLWQNPRLAVPCIFWDGEEDQLQDFNKANKEINRKEHGAIVALLSARDYARLGHASWASLLPKDLVRGELINFLI